jgi:hypothetical protein
MANKTTVPTAASKHPAGTKRPTVAELREWYAKNERRL